MQRVELQRVLESVNGLRKLFGLHVGCAEEIPGVGVVGIEFDDVLERVNRALCIARILREQAEVVPRVRDSGILLQHSLECGFGLVNLLQVQEGDAFIQARNCQLRIQFRGLPE